MPNGVPVIGAIFRPTRASSTACSDICAYDMARLTLDINDVNVMNDRCE